MINSYIFHSPEVLNDFSFLSIGKNEPYINAAATQSRFTQDYVASEGLIDSILKNHKQHSYLIMSGSFITQLRHKNAEQVKAIKVALKAGHISLLGTTYHMSVASLFSIKLFEVQVQMHLDLLKEVFDYTPIVFYNTKNIYFDKISEVYDQLGFEAALVPYSEWHLDGRSHTQAFSSKDKKIKLLIQKDNELSIAESNSNATESYLVPYPLYDDEQLLSKIASGSRLIESLKTRITSLVQAIENTQETPALAELSALTALTHFEKVANAYDISSYDNYINLMNMLSDLESR